MTTSLQPPIPLPAPVVSLSFGGGGEGGGGVSRAGSATPDTTPPSVSLIAPAANSTISGSSITLTATASDNVAVANVQFKVDGANIGTAITSSPYTTTWNSTGVADGAHTLYAVAEDTSGNYATSTINVTVRNSPPVISSVATSSPSGTSETITWSTDEAATSVINYGTSTGYGSTATSSTLATSHSVTLSGLTPDATYDFQIESADAENNTATSSNETFLSMYPMPDWATAKLAVSQGTRNAKLIFYGESTTGGIYAGGNSNEFGNALSESYGADVVASTTNASDQTFCGEGNDPVNAGTVSTLISMDPRWSGGSTWTVNSGNNTLGATFLEATASSPSTLTFTPASSFNTIDLRYLESSGAGSFTVNVDGSTTTITQTNSTTGYADATISVPLGTYPINFAPSSGTILLSNFAVYNSSAKQITSYICGWSGGTAADLSEATNPYDSLNALQEIAPDMTVVLVMANDADASTSISTYQSEMQSIITAAKQSGDAILVTDAPIETTMTSMAQQDEYLNVLTSLAQSNGVNLVNLYNLWGSWTQANANGWMANAVHPDAAGYAQIADDVLPYLLYTPPLSVFLTAPTSGGTVSGSSVTLTANASDGLGGVSNVQFEVDGTDIGSAITSPPYTMSWNSTGVSDGSHTLYAVAKDMSGLYATSSVSVSVENNPPLISSIASTTGYSSATITWNTNNAANSEVIYGTTTSYGSASSSAALATSHSIALSGLSLSATYHYAVVSKNTTGQTSTSTDQTFTTTSITDPINLVAYWPLDTVTSGTTPDDSGNGNSGTLNGSPSLITGQIDNALSFNGSSQYVAANGAVSEISPTGNYSISGWFKTTSTAAQEIFGFGNTGLSNPISSLAIGIPGPGDIYFSLRDNSGINIQASSTVTTFNDGSWHFALGVKNGSTFSVYVDGALQSSVSGSTGAATFNSATIGALVRSSIADYFSGDLDDVRIYNTALSTSSITGIYDSGIDGNP